MLHKPVNIERLFNATIDKVWSAITSKEEMKVWYFDLKEFKPEVGFQFDFMAGPDSGQQYLHICEITEVIQNKKLTYSWKFEGYSGLSYVTFELFEIDDKTLLKLTHSGIETFPNENPDFAIHNFEQGWGYIINTSLKGYLAKGNYQLEFTVNTTIEKTFEGLANGIQLWWTDLFEGKSNNLGNEFTVRFGTQVSKTMKVDEFILNNKISWLVTAANIDFADINNKNEWINTSIVWELTEENNDTKILLTHYGLVEGLNCYEICKDGWKQYSESFKKYLETGVGEPFKK